MKVAIAAVAIPTTALGAPSTWVGLTDTQWSTGTNWSLNAEPTAADDLTFPTPVPGTGSVLTLSAGELANSLSFQTGYTLNGGDLSLTAVTGGGVRVNLAETAIINSQLAGTGGITKTGGGTVVLGNSTNSFSGVIAISNGTVAISNAAALGTGTSQIVVSGSATRGLGGGSLLLDGGYASGVNLTRAISLQGLGPITDRSTALTSVRTNTLSGLVSAATGNVNTVIHSASGRLTFAGGLDVAGTAGTTITTMGVVNSTGVGSYEITGPLTGTGTLNKNGAGTLLLNPSAATGFSGAVRVSAGTVRVTNAASLGTANGATTAAPIDMNGGILEVRMDTPTIGKNVYFRASSTMFVDHGVGGTAINGVATFGTHSFDDNQTSTFNGRNGYGMSFTAAPVNGGANNSTFTNNLNGLLSFTGAFWSNADNAAARTVTINGTGDTLISGNITASAAAFDHNLTKGGAGTLTISSTGSTLDGAVNVQAGTLAIADFRSITNNTAVVGIGNTTTAATFSVVGNNLVAANATTSKVINLAGTTGGATILANQTGTSPGLIFNANFTATGGAAADAKTLTLGGANTLDNTINGVIPNNAAGGTVNLLKLDAGTWVLGGTNTYTGSTTITAGTLKIRANAATSTVIANGSAIIFNANNVNAGGTLEFVGQASTNNVETLGALTPSLGAGTVRLTPGAGGTASLVFGSVGTIANSATVNFVSPGVGNNITLTGATALNIHNAGLHYNGANFAFVGAGNVLRAPLYGDGVGGGGSDLDFFTTTTALTAGMSNEITGGFTNGLVSIDSLRIAGSHTLDMSDVLTVATAGSATASGGILQTGGSGVIQGVGVTTGGSGALVFRVDGASDVLTLSAPVTSTTTGGLVKSGAGTLVISGVNAQTGSTAINEGTVRLSGAGVLSANGATFVLRQNAVLDLNGVNTGTAIGQFNNNGRITNSAATNVTLTFGNGNVANGGGGTSFGIIEDGTGGGRTSVTATGANNVTTESTNYTLNGVSTYTGATTIATTALGGVTLIAPTLANIGQDSSIGRGIATNAATNAASLVFSGPASSTQTFPTLSYTGRASISTDRLFTFGGTVADSGARLLASGNNNAAIIWSNTGALAFGTPDISQGLVLGGTSTADNRFNPQITNNGTGAVSVYKSDAGVWILGNAANSYTGVTQINAGTLQAADGTSLPTGSNLVLNGGVLESSGTISRTLGTGAGNVNWINGGFAASSAKLVVNLGAGTPAWNTTPNFVLGTMTLGSATSLAEVELVSNFEITAGTAGSPAVDTTNASTTVTIPSGTLGLAVGQTISGTGIPAGATIANITGPNTITLSAAATATGTGVTATIAGNGVRQITVTDNGTTQTDFATVTGVISGAGNLRKTGGTLQLFGANTYSGQTLVDGALVVNSLGNSALSTGSSVGTSVGANLAAGGLNLGVTTTAAVLQYVGPGETSDRFIQLSGTTASNQIHADGSGPLILTNVNNTATVDAKTLILRGSNTQGNMITSVLANNTGVLSLTVDGGATWILTGANTYTGTTALNAGATGVGSATAFGTGTVSLNNSSIFAFGADRTLANPITHVNNTTQGFIGDYSLTFTGTYAIAAAANSVAMTNTIASNKVLTLGAVTANSMTAARTWTINGTGNTTVTGSITTTTTFGLNITNNSTGVLTLSGAGSDWNTGTLTMNAGTLRLGANEVIAGGVGGGNVTFAPAAGVTVTLDLNGKTETINGLTATSAGTTIFTSATPATLTFGDQDAAVTFGAATGSHQITGPVSLVKTGTAGTGTATMLGTLAYTGTTTVNNGTMNINAPVTGTTALNASAGTLNLNAAASGGTVATVSTSGTGVVNLNGGVTFAANATLSASGGTVNHNLPSTGGTVGTISTIGSGTVKIAAPLALSSSASISAVGGSSVLVNAPFSGGNIGSVTVQGTSTLNLTDGVGTPLSSATLNTLTLGSAGQTSVLGLELGANNAGSDNFNITGAATVAANSTIRFNIFGLPGFGTSGSYNLLTAAGGGLTPSGVVYQLGVTPAGYTYVLGSTANAVTLGVTVAGGPFTHYWRGAINNSWAGSSGPNTNFTSDLAGSINAAAFPGPTTSVIFGAATAVGPSLSTTLDGSFAINDIQFTSAPAGVTSVLVAPGAGGTLSIAPAVSTAGISVGDNAGTVTISAPITVGAAQTWNVVGTGANGSALNISGALTLNAGVTKTGAGNLRIDGAPLATQTYGTGGITLAAGTMLLKSNGASSFGSINYTNPLTVAGAVTLDVNNVSANTNNIANFSGGLTVNSGSLTTAGGNGYTVSVGGATTIGGSVGLASGTTPLTLAGQVTHSNPANVVSVTNPNTFTTGLLTQGVRLTNTAGGGSANNVAGSFNVATGATLHGMVAAGGSNSLGNAAITLNGGTLRLSPDLSAGGITGTNGFAARYYNGGNNTTLSLINTFATPAATETVATINLPTNAGGFIPGPAGVNATNVAALYTGVLNVTTPGAYTFFMNGDDTYTVYVDGVPVSGRDGAGGGFAGTDFAGVINLTAGQHTISQKYSQGTGGGGTTLQYQGPDTANAKVFVGSIAGSVITPGAAIPTAVFGNTVTLTPGTTSIIDIPSDVSIAAVQGGGALTQLNVTGTGLANRLTIAAAMSLPGDLTVNAQTANVTLPAVTVDNAVAPATLTTLTVSGNATDSQLSGVISDNGTDPTKQLALTKLGGGTWTLQANNTYSGATTVTAGTLAISADERIPHGVGKGDVTANGTINLNGFNETINGLSGTGAVDGISGTPTLTVGGNNASGSFSGIIRNTAGTLAVTKIGTGTQTLSGASTFTGALTVNGGLVAFATSPATAGPLGNSTVVNLSGGGISYTAAGPNAVNRAIAIGAGTGSVDVANALGVLTVGSISSTGGTLVKTGPGTAVLGGPTTAFAGAGVSVTDGVLRSTVALNPAGIGTLAVTSLGNFRMDNATIETITLNNTTGALTLGGTGRIGFELNGLTADSIAVGATGTAVSSGTITLDFFNTGAGVTAGTYNLLSSTLGGLSGASYVLGTAPNGFNYTINTTDNLVSLTTVAYTPIYFRGGQSPNLSWNVLGGPTANWTTDAAGTVNASALPGPNDTVIFSATGTPTVTNTITTTLDAAFTVDSVQFSNVPTGVTAVTINPGTGGALTLTPASTSGGIRVLSGGGNATIASPLTVGASQTWDVDPTGSLTISGNTAFNFAVNKTGTGALTLSGNNTGTGAITLTAGRLNINSATAIGTGVLNVGAGTTLDNTSAGAVVMSTNNVQNWGGDFTFVGTQALTFGTGAVSLSAGSGVTLTASASTLTVGGTIGDGGSGRSFTKAGAGTVVLNGAVTIGGNLNNTAGTLTVNAPATVGGGVTNAGTTTLAAASSVVGAVSSTAGTLTLAAANTIGGGVSVTGGLLNIGNAGSLGAGTLTIGAATIDNTSGGPLTLSTNNTQIWSGNFTFTGTNNLNLGTGPVTLTASRTVTVAANTLTVGGPIAGTANIVKAGPGTLTLGATNAITGSTTVLGGTLNANATQGIGAGAIVMGDTTNNFGTLVLAENNNATTLTVNSIGTTLNTNTITIAPTKTLTLTGNVAIGPTATAANQLTRLNIGGGGNLVVATAAGGTFRVGGNNTANAFSENATLDLTGLASASVNLSATGTFAVSSTAPTNVVGNQSQALMAPTTTIVAGTLSVGDGAGNNGGAGQVNVLTLGNVANTLNANTINIGTGGRDAGQMVFGSASGTVAIRGAAGGATRAALNIGAGGVTTGVQNGAGVTNLVDFNGHSADALISTLTMGIQNRAATYVSTFNFNTGTLDITNIVAGTRTAENTNGAGQPRITNVDINFGGGSVNIGSGITQFGDLAGNFTTATQLPTINTNLNISGGTVTIGATSGTAINMARILTTGSTVTETVNSSVNLTGGTTTVLGNIEKVGISGTGTGTKTANATVNLNGATAVLNMSGNAIGSLAQTVVLNAQAGTLQNLGQLNGGAALTKTTAGTLIMGGVNTYTGATNINEGIVQAAAANTLPSGTVVNLANLAATSLDLNGFNQTIGALTGGGAAGGNVTLGVGTLTIGGTTTDTYSGVISGSGGVTRAGTGTTNLNGPNTYAGSTTVTGGALVATTTLESSVAPMSITGAGSSLTALRIAPSSLTIGVGASAKLTNIDYVGSFAGRSTAGTLANTGLLDVNTTGIVIASAVEADVRAQIISGRNAGTWTGTTGITSSAAIADPANRAVGYNVSGATITVAQTIPGDSNLDGIVNVLDRGTYLANVGQSPRNWQQADWNYDDIVNVLDRAIYLGHVGMSLPTPPPFGAGSGSAGDALGAMSGSGSGTPMLDGPVGGNTTPGDGVPAVTYDPTTGKLMLDTDGLSNINAIFLPVSPQSRFVTVVGDIDGAAGANWSQFYAGGQNWESALFTPAGNLTMGTWELATMQTGLSTSVFSGGIQFILQNGNLVNTTVEVVPEPTGLALAAMAGLGLLARRRRRA